jgi:hypothetical protein
MKYPAPTAKAHKTTKDRNLRTTYFSISDIKKAKVFLIGFDCPSILYKILILEKHISLSERTFFPFSKFNPI